MLDPKIFEDFGARMSALLANSPAADLEKTAKALLGGFLRLGAVLTLRDDTARVEAESRLRELNENLEARVEALEKARQA